MKHTALSVQLETGEGEVSCHLSCTAPTGLKPHISIVTGKNKLATSITTMLSVWIKKVRSLSRWEVVTNVVIVVSIWADGRDVRDITSMPGMALAMNTGRWGQPKLPSYHRWRAGYALDSGSGWRATDGVEDMKRVWKNTLHAIFHRTDLKGAKVEEMNERLTNITNPIF